MKQCVKITISGKVQGVGYRRHVQAEAEKLNIEGTVQNQDEGHVIIFACGPSENLDNFIDALYRGPKKAQVENVAVEPFVAQKDFRGVFRIIGL